MAGKREPLEVARARFLARTAKLLDDELDVTDPAESLRRMGPLLARFRTAARREALDVIQGRASAAMVEALGTDLGWDAVNADRWLGRDAQARYALRLVRVADDLEAKVKAGKDPAELAAWVRYWQIQVAGSDVHEVARRATLDTAAQLPTGGRVMRIAEPRACDWCLTQASRGAVFHSEATALATSHGHCRCDLVLVSDPDAIKQTIDEGRIAWAESGMAAKDFPLASKAKSAAVPDSVWRPGSGTPERLMSARLQLQQVDDVIARNRPLADTGDEQAKKVLAWNESMRKDLLTELGESGSSSSLPTRGSDVADVQQWALSGANPNFKSGANEFHYNCTHCVNAHEYRLRGFDVQAQGGLARHVTDWIKDWQHSDGSPVLVSELQHIGTKTNLVRFLQSAGDGARCIVRVRWKGAGGHVFLGINDGGVIRFLDSQSGIDVTADKTWWAGMKKQQIWAIRVDTLELLDPGGTLTW